MNRENTQWVVQRIKGKNVRKFGQIYLKEELGI